MSALFPELEAPRTPEAPPPPKRAPSQEGPTTLRASPACTAAFTRALALPVEVLDVEVLPRDRVRINTRHGDGRRAIFLVHPGERAWKRVAGFGVTVEGPAVEPELAKALQTFLGRYHAATLRSFAELVRKQSSREEQRPAPEPPQEPAKGAAPTPWHEFADKRLPDSTPWNENTGRRSEGPDTRVGDPNNGTTERWNDHDGSRAARLDEPDPDRLKTDMRGALFFSYGAKAGWRTFFEDHDLYRGGCSHIEGRVATVMHREIECTYNLAPETAWGRGSFGSLPDDPRESAPEQWSILLDTDLNDRDVIMGGDARLDAAFDAIAAMPVRPDLVLVQSTCVPVVTGDDLEASAERARRKHRLPIAVVGYIEHPHASALVSQLEQVHSRCEPHTAVLLGMPRIAGIGELIELMRDAGVTLLGPMIPDLPSNVVDDFSRASLLVTYDEPHSRDDVKRALEILNDRRSIAPTAPFGPEGSRLFCREIADALGMAEAFDARWEEGRAAWAPRWDALVERAKGYRAGFVVERADWGSRIERRMGVPLLDAVRAMGFGVDVYAWVRPGEDVREPDDPDVRVHRYATQDELEALLKSSPAAIFYSEMRYDRRLPRTGHASFSLEELRVGPTGALASLETLLARCETPWYRRYGRLAGTAFNAGGAR
jgi:hypothetical protein